MNVTCDTYDLMQMIDATCDTNDLMKMVDKNAIKEVVDDSFPGHEMDLFMSSELMNGSFVEDESQKNTQSDTSSGQCEFELTK